MSSKINEDILNLFQSTIPLPNTQGIVDWSKQIYLSNPPYNKAGYFNAHNSRYLVEPLQAIADDDNCRECVVVGNPRSGKSLLAEILLMSVLKGHSLPSDVWWAVHKADTLKGIMDTRLLPLMQANGVKFTDDRFQKTQRFIKFPVGSLKLVGAQNSKGMTQLNGRVLVGDELHVWTEGVLEQFKTRANDFPFSKKILLISMAGDDGKDLHREWLKGHQADYGFKCPHCGFEQAYVFHFQFDDGKYGGFNWEDNDDTRPKGVWDIDKAAETAHYTCTNPQCRHDFYQSSTVNRQLNDCGLYIPANPSAAIGPIRSFRWNALATPDIISHRELCREWLIADVEAGKGRYKAKRNYWVTHMSDFFAIGKTNNQLQGIIGDLDTSISGSTLVPVMGVDNNSQSKGLPYVICTYVPERKEIHITKWGIGDTYADIQSVQIANRVKHQRVLLDARFNQHDNVYQAIYDNRRLQDANEAGRKVPRSWFATKGVGLPNGKAKSWSHGLDPRTKKEVVRPYSPVIPKPVHFGTNKYIKGFSVKEILFHGDTVKDTLNALLTNQHVEWKLIIPQAAKDDKEFMAQLNSEQKITVVDKSGYPYKKWHKDPNVDNDWFDALGLCILAGMVIYNL